MLTNDGSASISLSTENLFSRPENCLVDGTVENILENKNLEKENGSIDVGIDAPDFLEPKIGMEFPNDTAAYAFYNKYAFHIGFSVRKELIRRNKLNIPTMRTYTCSKHGLYRDRSSRDKPRERKQINTRTNCKAHMRVNICRKGVYKVKSFEPKHNHSLASPSKRQLLKSHKIMNDSQKAIADVADSAGLKPKQTYDFLAKQAGGRKHLTFLPDDYKNYLKSKRMRAMELGDAGAVMQYLQTRVKEDPSFYYAVQLDEDDLITNIFWADGRSLLDYDCFGEVICFDSTYKTNEYGRPFAPFVGVNHHRQTVVFRASQGTPGCQFSNMLKQAASILTPNVYKIFEAEYICFLNCSLHYDGKNGNMHKYLVISGGNGKKNKKRTVWYDSLKDTVTCSCLKFEFVGVQCCHVLKVLDAINIKELPEKYYLKRWRKDAKLGKNIYLEGLKEADPKVDMANRYSSMLRVYTAIFSRASQSERAYKYMLENASVLSSKIEALTLEENIETISQNDARVEDETPSDPCVPPYKVPKAIKKKDGGRGRRREKGALEKNKKTTKKKSVKNVSPSEAIESSRSENNSFFESQSFGHPLLASNSISLEMYAYGSASELLNVVQAPHYLGKPF